MRRVAELSGGDAEEALLVPDTNALYAAPALEEWQFEECTRFALVLVLPVLNEIGDHKDHHKNPDVREKARRLVRQVREYQRRGRLVVGVVLRGGRSRVLTWPHEPDLARSLPWLSADRADDRIRASAIDVARTRARSPVAIATRDLHFQTRCELARVFVLWPPEIDEDAGSAGLR